MKVALLCCVLGLAAACGDDGVSVNTSASNFCGEIAEVVCHNLYQCCTESEIEDKLSVSEPRTENQCREDYERACLRNSQELRDSLENGRVQLDAARLNDCLNAVLAPDGVCGTVVTELPWKEACGATPWVGTSQPMGACFFDFDCAGWPDAECGPDQKCKLKGTSGVSCSVGCASDYYCAPLTNTCAPKSDLNGQCTTDSQCNNKKDLYCLIPPLMTEGTCQARGAAGAACTKPGACLSFECAPGLCSGTNDECYQDSDCDAYCADDFSFCDQPSDCGNGLCNATGTLCNEFTPCDTTSFPTNTCVYSITCQMSQCIGDPVCTAPLIVTDYCSAVNVIPSP